MCQWVTAAEQFGSPGWVRQASTPQDAREWLQLTAVSFVDNVQQHKEKGYISSGDPQDAFLGIGGE